MNLPSILGTKLSENAFLRFIFHPKKEKRPTGVRKRQITGRGKGRKASRIRSYNKLDPFKQRTIDAVGRERYLRGEVSLGEAKRELRPEAIRRGLAKPVRQRKITPPSEPEPVPIDDVGPAIRQIAEVVQERDPLRDNGEAKSPVSYPRIVSNVETHMTSVERAEAARITYLRLKEHATTTRNLRIDTITGEIYNPWWYH